MQFSARLAMRYLFGKNTEQSIAYMILVCFASILVGSFSLTLVTIIMNGFEKATYDTIRGLHAPLIMEDMAGNELNVTSIEYVIQKEFPAIHAISPSSSHHIITQSHQNDMVHIVILKGISPSYTHALYTLAKNILHPPNTSISSLFDKNNIIVGYKLAQQLAVQIGDEIEIFLPHDTAKKHRTITLTKHSARIAGLIKAGIDEVDSKLVISSLTFFNTLFPKIGITHIELYPTEASNEETIIEKLRDRFGLFIYSWKELYPALVSALLLEKYAMFFILALITLVASMNIISLLFMYITHKKGDLAILLAMGMRPSSIRSIFIIIGMSITFCASISGLLCAYGIGYILQHYPFITLPDVYYVSHLPAHMEWHIFILSFMIVMAMSFCATWISTGNIARIKISEVLRFEA